MSKKLAPKTPPPFYGVLFFAFASLPGCFDFHVGGLSVEFPKRVELQNGSPADDVPFIVEWFHK